jgi:hypothetical protein
MRGYTPDTVVVMTSRQVEQTIATLSTVTAVNAIAGSVYGLSGAANVPHEWLEGSPFEDYTVPSVILGVAVGGSSAAAAAAAWVGHRAAGPTSVLAGVVLSGWIAAQVAIIGPRSFLQPVMGGVGITMIALGTKLRRLDERAR